ncbi:MAG: glycosyltransferase [Oscillospiraceae bacterium]
MEDRTKYRVGQVLARTKKLRRLRERHALEGLTVICLLLTVGLTGMFGAVIHGNPSIAPETETFATMLLHEDASGYVLVGVLAFAAGAFITMFCIWRNRHSRGGNHEKADSDTGTH